ncbi:MAG: VWA domain-containing protein [Acidobacteria bacterium]|nr:VWA domain-containing protein [Acidobacteriota bacterium]
MNETQKKIKQDGQDLQHKRNKNICVYLCSSAVKFLCVLSYLNGFILLLSFGIFAQNNDDVIRIETDLIPFEVTVTDKNGKPVRGLDVKDFKLFEDGAERPIDFFEPIKRNDDSRPLSIVFALDVSGSIAPEELVKLRSALESFVKRLADYDSYFAVMTFGMQVKTLQSFTNRPDKLEKTFEKLLREQDGLLPTPLEASGLLEKTGGRAFYATEKSFEPLFKSLAEEITASYVLAFYPKAENRQSKTFRRVRIEVPTGFQVKQNRAGYEIKQ